MNKSLFSVLICSVALLGCTPGGGAAKLPTHPVTGKVVMNGAPVPLASVTFSPIAAGKPPALGQTDAAGVYTLTTYAAGDGAVAGDYKILVFKSAGVGAAGGEPAHDPTGQGGGPSAPQHARGGKPGATGSSGSLLPEKYSSATTTTLQKTVTEGDNTIDLTL
ncbi:MAG: hypothetical protein R3C53_13930 [Pirellulaceae bacterium]